MSDPNLIMQRQIQDLQDGSERLRKADVPPLYLPWAQRILNPFPLASSGGVWGEMAQPWAVNVLAFYCSVFVSTTNDGANFWTIAVTARPSGNVIATVSTAAIAASTRVRLADTSITQPASTDVWIDIIPTATLAPGAIFIVPTVALLRTGN